MLVVSKIGVTRLLPYDSGAQSAMDVSGEPIANFLPLCYSLIRRSMVGSFRPLASP